MKARLIAVALWLVAAGQASAWTWLQAAQEPELEPELAAEIEPVAIAGAADGVCIAAILQAQQRYQIPDNLLLALGLQEAGWKGPRGLTIWPYSVNAAGEGRRFNSRLEAEAFVHRKQAQGVSSIDVGCLQINLHWHPDAFASLSQGFDPVQNIDYAARFLRSLYDEAGDWWQAAGRYHSRSSAPQAVYLAQLKRNHQVAMQRYDRFAALAEGIALDPAFEAGFEAGYAPKPEPEPPNYRSSGPIWGAAIAGDEGARRTLYSATDLEPILPSFLPPET